LGAARNILRGCMDKTVDMALAKNIRLGGQRNLQFRMDVFNLFNTYVITNRQNTVTFPSQSNLAVVKNQFTPGGTVNQSRLTPPRAGFGAATDTNRRGAEAGLGNNYNRVM